MHQQKIIQTYIKVKDCITKPNDLLIHYIKKEQTMKMLLRAVMPLEPFNSMVHKGTVGKNLEKIMGDLKPESVYFTLTDGERTALMVVNINKPSDYVKYAEPFFLLFDAECSFDILMSADELKTSGIEEIGKKYA